ncbi:MAG: hypothetical protein RMJ36_00435 [Candidatus Calescibacterium sp.]|nr:hypothetical protein [Candidatus Calescibacterium sp.]MDW8132112.1 hypothetical protein [Candidatus Calescibacterium sp.]
MTIADLLKFVGGIIVAVIFAFLSFQINYSPVVEREASWQEQLKRAQEIYQASIQIKQDYEKYQKMAEEYERLRNEVFPQSKGANNEAFMSLILKNLEGIVTDVRNSSKDKDFKLNNINFGAISNRNIGASEESEGIAVRSTEITMSLNGKYSTIIKFLRELSDTNKIGALIRIKTISFSPSTRDVGKSPTNSINITLEMIQIIR